MQLSIEKTQIHHVIVVKPEIFKDDRMPHWSDGLKRYLQAIRGEVW